MAKLFNLFRRRKKTMVFVDYEYWFYSYRNQYHIWPDPKHFREMLISEFDIADIMIFGDFSSPVISPELGKVRNITNTIIETGNSFQRHKKDMTDFVILDYIYRCEDDNKNIGTYIIFSGDGHFQSVVKHLVQRKKKRVVVYGIKDTVSKQLQAVASEVRLLPTDEEIRRQLYRLIASNMAYAQTIPTIIPSFNGTVDAVVNRNHVDRNEVRAALSEILEQGYLYQRERIMDTGRTIKVMMADWDKLDADGIWKHI